MVVVFLSSPKTTNTARSPTKLLLVEAKGGWVSSSKRPPCGHMASGADLQNDLLADIGWEEGSGSGEPGSGSGEPGSGEPSPQPEDLSFLYYTVPIVAVLLAVCACLCICLRRRAARRRQIMRLWQQHIQDASGQEPFLDASKGGSVNSPATREN